MTEEDQISPRISTMVADLRAATVFLTAIPISALGYETGQSLDFRRSAWIFPIVGGLIGIVGGLIVVICTAFGMPALVAAALAVAGIVLVCGALHEDGLADTADGFGGGRTIERKLAIMSDSRIGAFGTLALILSLILRVAALAALARAGGLHAAAGLIAAEAASRGAMVRLWHDLPAARPGGMSDRAGRPGDQTTLVAALCSILIAAVAIVPAFGFVAAIVAVLVLIIASFCFARLAIDQIGGQTGDILGACQQITATTLLIVLTAFL